MSNPRGRQAIGVNQPPSGGSLFPFVQPSSDIQLLLGDFFLSFRDFSNQYQYPLRVAWMFGFGTNVVTPPAGWPTPTHTHDIVVVDAAGAVVFDSTGAEFSSSTWDDRLLILEWKLGTEVCRCTMYTQWTAADIADGQNIVYDNYIEPENGELQQECWYKLPKHLTSIQVGLTFIEEKSVVFSEGYNMGLTVSEESSLPPLTLNNIATSKLLVPGKRNNTRVQLDAVPGNGLGVFPGCVETTPTLRTINKIKGNEYQNFTYDAEGCIRVQRPVSVLSPYTTFGPRDIGYASTGLTTAQASSAIKTSNNCVNCCDCTYFAQTYQGIKRQWFLYKDLADEAVETRDLYHENRTRWLAASQAWYAQQFRARFVMDGQGKARWGFSFCNSTRCCLANITFYIGFLVYINGEFVTPYFLAPTTLCDCFIENSINCKVPRAFVPREGEATDPDTGLKYKTGLFTVNEGMIDSTSQTFIYGRACFPDAINLPIGAMKVRLWLAATWDNLTLDYALGTPCLTNAITDIPPDAENLWELSGFPMPVTVYSQELTDPAVVSKDNPFCSTCNCPPV